MVGCPCERSTKNQGGIESTAWHLSYFPTHDEGLDKEVGEIVNGQLSQLWWNLLVWKLDSMIL